MKENHSVLCKQVARERHLGKESEQSLIIDKELSIQGSDLSSVLIWTLCFLVPYTLLYWHSFQLA